MKRLFSIVLSLAVSLAAVTLVNIQPVLAASFVVNSSGDVVDAAPGDGACQTVTPGECTLRAAIQEANALAGDDTITLPATTIVLSIAGTAENASLDGDLDITSNILINGASASTTIIDGNAPLERVFHVLGGNVSISNVTIQGGDAGLEDGGGVLLAGGSLALGSSRVTDNEATNGAGVAVSGGSLAVNFTSIGRSSSNVATGSGGGLYVTGGGTAVVNNSTLADNTAANGGGAFIAGGSTVTFNNSTISTNIASGSGVTDGGGGLFVSGVVALNSVTIGSNDAPSRAGGGVLQLGGVISLRNTIIADNTNSGSTSPDCSGTLVSLGFNLLDNNQGCGGIVNNVNGDIVVSSITPSTTFALESLADNGGPTHTHAILTTGGDSVLAVDRGNPAGCGDGGSAFSTDQRGPGFIRTQNFRCDIGAFEYIFTGSEVTLTPTFTLTPSVTPIPSATFTPGPTSTPAPSNTFTATFTNTFTVSPTGSLTASATYAPKLPLFTSLPPTVDIVPTLTAAAQALMTQSALTAAAAVPTVTPDVAQTATTFALTNAVPTATLTNTASPTPGPTLAFPSETGVLAVSQSIGRAGGQFVCGLWMLEAPNGAVPEGSKFQCNTLASDDSAIPALPGGLRGFWQTADIRIANSAGTAIESFTEPLTLCAYYSEGYQAEMGGDTSRFTIYTASSGGEWQALATTPDPSTNRVCTTVDHFSLFRLAGQPAPATGGIFSWFSGGVVGVVAIACGVLLLVVVLIVVFALIRRRKPKEAEA